MVILQVKIAFPTSYQLLMFMTGVIIDYHIDLTCEGKHAAYILERALWKRKLINTPNRPVIRSDNGPQFISNVFEEYCKILSVENERIPPKTPNINAQLNHFTAF